jgi:hypothetical protein
MPLDAEHTKEHQGDCHPDKGDDIYTYQWQKVFVSFRPCRRVTICCTS